jgi:hypothetical protein
VSSDEVWSQVYTYFTDGLAAGSLPGVSDVFEAMPWYVSGEQWQLSKELGSGSILFPHIAHDGDAPIALPGVYGQKSVRYEVAVICIYQYLIPTKPPAGERADAWVHPYRATIEAIKALIRADPTLGNPTLISQAGRERNDIQITRHLPRRAPGKIVSWNVVEFTAKEIIQG